jgi:hypothetical protein
VIQENIQKIDTRWKQRFENYGKSLVLLSDIVNSIDKSVAFSNKDRLSINELPRRKQRGILEKRQLYALV